MKNKINYKIKLIICYIGAFPEYFPLWLRSCEKNPMIDFMVVTDQKEPDWYPKNVYFFKTNMKELKLRFESKVDFSIGLESPYKLCDFRPLYGLAFQEELYGYDFWGHCDIDLVWGDIRSFITDNILEKYDRIGKQGHFTIYRNTPQINNAFTLSGGTFNYKEVFMNSENFAFDEISGMNLILKNNKIPFLENINIADISYYYYRIRLDKNDYPYELFYWDNGCCYRSYIIGKEMFTEQYMYIHFQKKKFEKFINFPQSITSFLIKEDGFYKKEPGIPNIKDILKYCVYKDNKFEQKEKRQYKIDKIKSMIKRNWREKYIWIKQQIAFKKYDK